MATRIYHYNVHSEQRYFLGIEHKSLYDIIFFNGNIVSHTPAGVAAFLSTTGKDFYIDPQTHVFQHATMHLKADYSDAKKGEPPNFQFKPSIKKLANERLGDPFSRVIEQDKPLSPSDFLNDDDSIKKDIIKTVCENVINFQENTMKESLDEEALEYLSENPNFQPKFIIAPYFFLSPIRFKNWLKITIECYRMTKDIEKNLPIYLVLAVSKEALDKGLKGIIDEVSKIKPDGIILWIDEHKEEDLCDSEIVRFINLLKGLRGSTDKMLNSHGGYLSILLCHSEIGSLLNGVGHCINYGESRSIVPVGGGIPMARFYFPSLHSRLRYGDALAIAVSKNWLSSKDAYRDNICRCVQCTELINKSSSIDEAFLAYGESHPVTFRRRSGTIVQLEYPTTEAKQAAARHYLYNKAREFNEIEIKAFAELLEKLESTKEDIGDDLVTHLSIWKSALQKLAS